MEYGNETIQFKWMTFISSIFSAPQFISHPYFVLQVNFPTQFVSTYYVCQTWPGIIKNISLKQFGM